MRNVILIPERLELRLQQIRPPAGALSSHLTPVSPAGNHTPQTFRESLGDVYVPLCCRGTLGLRSGSQRLHQTGRTINHSWAEQTGAWVDTCVRVLGWRGRALMCLHLHKSHISSEANKDVRSAAGAGRGGRRSDSSEPDPSCKVKLFFTDRLLPRPWREGSLNTATAPGRVGNLADEGFWGFFF